MTRYTRSAAFAVMPAADNSPSLSPFRGRIRLFAIIACLYGHTLVAALP